MSAAFSLPDVQEAASHPKPHVLRSNDIELNSLTTLLLFAPLAFGAVEAWAVFVLQFGACLIFCTWILRQSAQNE